MRSRQDQLHAYQYATQRVVAALVSHDPDPQRSRLNRTGSTVLVGLLIALIGLGGTYAYAAITGGGATELRNEAAIFVEKETGAQYVYTRADDRLHPVLNYTSGLLIANTTTAKATTLRRTRMATLQRDTGLRLGAPLGIPDAPTSPPEPADLLRDPWHLCTVPPTAPGARARSHLMIGAPDITTGHLLAWPGAATTIDATAEALLVADAAGREFLVYANHKFLIRKRAAVLTAFGWAGRQAYRVSNTWINAVPAGPDLEPLRIAGLRQRSAVLEQPIGRLYRAPGQGGSFQWAVLQRRAVLPVTEVQAGLLAADPATDVGAPVTLSTAAFSALPTADADPLTPGQDLLPATVPSLVPITTTACLTVNDATTGVSAVRVDPRPATGRTPATGAAAETAGTTSDPYVSVPFGHGVLVEPAASPEAPAGSSAPVLVTDAGVRYPITDDDALTRLGYVRTTAQRMPAELVALLPEGPALGVAAALRPRA